MTKVQPQATTLKKPTPPFIVSSYGALGAFLACFIDFFVNDTAAITLKVKATLAKHFFEGANPHGLLVVLFVSILGYFLCRVKLPSNSLDALSRGLSVFTLLSLATPYSVNLKSQDAIPGPETTLVPIKFESQFEKVSSLSGSSTTFRSNGLVRENDWVSSCKPSYSGFLGTGSFFNNTIDICQTGSKIPPGSRIQILHYWDTDLRGYRYVEVIFLDAHGSEARGWIWAGKSPEYWYAVVPDNPASIPLLH